MSKLLKLATTYVALTSSANDNNPKITINQLSDVLEFLNEKIEEHKFNEGEVPQTLVNQYRHVEHMLAKRLSDLMVN
jgi:hypothetical protein